MLSAERAKRIRAELKEAGYNSRRVSVRLERSSLSSSIRVAIKDPSVDAEVVKSVASKYERYDRCPVTHEILSGGNCFVFVRSCEGYLVG